MKKAVLFVVAGAALYAAGYFTRYSTHPAAESEKKAGPVAAATAPRSGSAAAAPGAEKGPAEQSVRKFTAGRPFAKGGAKAWLLSLAGLDFDDESKIPELMDVVQSVMTMDEECAKEMADALMEIAQLYENDDPSLAAFPHADELVEGGLMLAMMRLSQFNPEAAVEMMKKYPDAVDEVALMFVFGRMAGQNPQHAEEVALSLPEESRGEALQAVLKSLSTKDPRAALALARKHQELDGSLIGEVLQSWAKRDPAAAATEAAKLSGEGVSHDLNHVFLAWLEKDEKAAEAWAVTHQEGPGKTVIQTVRLGYRARDDVNSVLEDYAKLQQSTKDQNELFDLTKTIADRMAENDVNAAKTWVEALPASRAKEAAVAELAEQWVKKDAEAASKWIKELPPGDGREAAASSLSEKIMRRDPASALEWARTIEYEAARNKRIKEVLEAWEEQDPDAAKAARSALPPDLQPGEDFDEPPLRIGGSIGPAR